MSKAYDWAFLNPVRKVFYNLTTTGLSIAVALVIGSTELLQVLINALRLRGGVYDVIARFDVASLGYLIVGLFLIAWGSSVAVWKFGRIDERYGGRDAAHCHTHTHSEGTEHSHEHLH